jgi:hypothetical protein
MPTGTATLNFGSGVGVNQASVAVTGQAGITTGSHVEAWLSPTPSATHNVDELKVLALFLGVFAHTLVGGVGFTITATTELSLTGEVNVCWVWV